jgi:Outer membrane protein
MNNKMKCILTIMAVCLPLFMNAQETYTLSKNLPAESSLNKLSVEACVDMALQNNFAIKNAQLEIDKAQATKNAARAEYFPSFSAQALTFQAQNPFIEFGVSDIGNATIRQFLNNIISEYGALWGYDNSISMIENGSAINLMATMPIYAGGRVRNGNKLAELSIEAADLQKEIQKDEVVKQTEFLYWQIVSLQEKRETLKELSRLLDTLYKDVKSASDAGLITPNDVLKVTIKKNECEQNARKVSDGITLLKMTLSQYIGCDWQKIELADSLEAEASPDMLFCDVHQAVSSRNETKLLDLSVKSQTLQKRMTMGEAMPTFAIGGSVSQNTLFDDPRSNMMAFAIVQIPISDWHKTAYNLKKQELSKEIAINNQNDLTQKMQLQTNQAWFSLQQSWHQIESAKVTVEDARANLKITEDFYEAGLVALSELLEAQTLLKQSLDELVDTRIEYKNNLLKYKQLVGK